MYIKSSQHPVYLSRVRSKTSFIHALTERRMWCFPGMHGKWTTSAAAFWIGRWWNVMTASTLGLCTKMRLKHRISRSMLWQGQMSNVLFEIQFCVLAIQFLFNRVTSQVSTVLTLQSLEGSVASNSIKNVIENINVFLTLVIQGDCVTHFVLQIAMLINLI